MNAQLPSPAQKSAASIVDEINLNFQNAQIAPGLQIGESALDFTLPDEQNHQFTLSDELKKGPVILSFYRGSWCSFCRAEFKLLQQNLDQFTNLNATLLGIGPQKPENAIQFVEKSSLGYKLLSDINQEVIKAYKIHFTLDKRIQDIYISKYGLDLWNMGTPSPRYIYH